MKKELLWKITGTGYLAVAGLALLTLFAGLPKWITAGAVTGMFIGGGVFLYAVSRHFKKLKSISRALGSQALIIPDDFKGTLLEEITQSVYNFLNHSQNRLAQAQEENQALSLQLQLLRRRKSNVEEIINSIRDAVVVTDDHQRVILANEVAENLFDFAFESKDPKMVSDLIRREELVEIIDKTFQSKTPHVRHELTFEKNERPVSFDVVLSCVRDENGNVPQVVAVLHDITREKEIAQMKNDFVSHVSHELKTPLASINAYAEMLVDGEAEDAETIQQFCGIIQSQAQRLSRLIEDILNISRIESGLIKVKKETHSLALVIRDAVEMIKSYAQEKNIRIESPAPILYDQVYVDRDMISQVVINLLSNAVKYTPAGGQIRVDSELDEVEGRVKMTVTDTGVGIPPEDVEHVFDKFYRVQANNQYAKGTGLGLNLVKQIVETVHEGGVFVTSTVGQGSTFGFELPLAAETAAQSV